MLLRDVRSLTEVDLQENRVQSTRTKVGTKLGLLSVNCVMSGSERMSFLNTSVLDDLVDVSGRRIRINDYARALCALPLRARHGADHAAEHP